MEKESADNGLYVVWFELDSSIHTPIGALGEGAFSSGLYAYVGSAQRYRTARIRRHLRNEKPRRWHIDYLLPQGHAVAVTLCDGGKEHECQLVQELIDLTGGARAFPRFGASDCRCAGHLLRLPKESPSSLTTNVDDALGAVTTRPARFMTLNT